MISLVPGNNLTKVFRALYGERVCACVVLHQANEDLTLEKITAFLSKKGLTPYKLPERMEILKAIPRSGGEKIRKDLLVKEILEKTPASD